MDNRYFNRSCPPLMQDGRFITNFMESRIFEQIIRNVNNIESSHDFRAFLQQNGNTIMNRERAFMNKYNTCDVNGQCVAMGDQGFKFPDCACKCPK
jgi:hypothetical protein